MSINFTRYRLYPDGTVIQEDDFEEYDNFIPYSDDYLEIEIPEDIIKFIEFSK